MNRSATIWSMYLRGKVTLVFLLFMLLLNNTAILCQEIHGSITNIELKGYKSGLMDTLEIDSLSDYGLALCPTMIDSAQVILERALEESEKVNYLAGITTAIFRLTVVYGTKGMYSKAIETFHQTYLFCSQNEALHPCLHLIINCIASMYQAQGNYEKAATYYYRSMFILEQFNIRSTGGIYTNMGELLMTLKQYKQALYFLDRAQRAAMYCIVVRKENCYDVLGYTFVNKSYYYASQKDWTRSKQYAQAALNLGRKYDFKQLQHVALIALGNTSLLTNNYTQSINHLQEAQSITNAVDLYYQNTTTRMLGEAYYKLHDFDKAEHYLTKALQGAQTSKMGSGLMETHKLLSSIYAEKHEPILAFEHYQKYVQMKDSISGIETTRSIAQLEVKYMTAKKDQELIQNQLLITQQQKWIAGIVVCMLILVIIFMILFKNYRHKQNIQLKQLHILQQEQEITQLKAMMEGEEKERTRIARELHDGIGGMLVSAKLNLGSIKEEHPETSHIKKLDDVMFMLQDIGSEIRKTAHNLIPDVLTRHSLQEALEIYCDNVNTGNKLEIDLQFQGDLKDLEKSTELMLYRIAQELIQNIVKHANATYAAIQIMRLENKLSVTVEDNGIGFDINEQNSGFGLQNLRFRIHALQGNLSIMSAKGRNTTVYIEFDYNKLAAANA